MRAFAVPVNYYCYCSYPCPLLQPSTSFINPLLFPSKFTNASSQSSLRYLVYESRLSRAQCSDSDSSLLDDNDFDASRDEDGYSLFVAGEEAESASENGIFIQIKKLGSNSRRIRSKIAINASLDTVWNILTDYEKLADFIPGLAVSKLIDKKDNFARLFQIGQQNLPLGLKFNAKALLDCFEKDIEILASGKKRDIEFKMTEGDFQFFEGKWSIEQVTKPRSEESGILADQEFETTLSYFVDVKPKLWLPVHLVEGRLCKEIQTNLSCIREEAQKMIQDTAHAQ